MLHNLKRFFDQNILAPSRAKEEGAGHALQVATAALLFEVMRMNGEMKDAERHALTTAVREQFELSDGEITTLLRLAEDEAKEATDYYQFTSLINKHYTAAQKEQIVEQMWRVAAADHEIDRFERTLVQKVADLLHVPRPNQIGARDRALRTARQNSDTTTRGGP